DVVENEEAIGLFQEEQVLLFEGKDRVIGAEKTRKTRVKEGGRVVAEQRFIPFRAHDASGKIEVEGARQDAKPVVVPARIEPKAAPLQPDREVANVPIQEHWNARHRVVAEALGVDEQRLALLAKETFVLVGKAPLRAPRTIADNFMQGGDV